MMLAALLSALAVAAAADSLALNGTTIRCNNNEVVVDPNAGVIRISANGEETEERQ